MIIRNADLFIYCPLIFCTHLLLVVRQISQSIQWISREQAASKNLWAKIYAYTRMSEKWGHSYTFCWKKKGTNHTPGSVEKGAIRHARPYYAIYRKLHPTHTHTHATPRDQFRLSYLTVKLQNTVWLLVCCRSTIFVNSIDLLCIQTLDPASLRRQFLVILTATKGNIMQKDVHLGDHPKRQWLQSSRRPFTEPYLSRWPFYFYCY